MKLNEFYLGTPIHLIEVRKKTLFNPEGIQCQSERWFAEAVLDIPGLTIKHEPVLLVNEGIKRRGETKPDFLLTSEDNVGAIVEVTVSRLGDDKKKRQINKCGCWLGEEDTRYGVCVRRNRVFHDNPRFPNPLSLIVIGHPAIENPDLIRKCVKRVMFGE